MTAPRELTLPADARFVPACARHILESHPGGGLDLSAATVVLPNLLLASELRQALAAAAAAPLLAPRFVTLSGFADRWCGEAPVASASRRAADLYAELASRAWVPEAARWSVARSLVALFDELTEAGTGLPADEDAFLAQVEQSYALRENQPLRLEARIAHALWRAESAGTPGIAARRRMALAKAADAAAGPLYLVCEGSPTPLQRELARRWRARAPAELLVPSSAQVETPLSMVLQAAWSGAPGEALERRAARVVAAAPVSPLAARVRLLAAEDLEGEAQQVVQAVLEHLAHGQSSIALVALDRLTARRARALLERVQVLVQDETGWRLSTTRAAALLDAWLEIVAADAYHRDLLDLAKSPFLLAGLDEAVRAHAAMALEHAILDTGYVAGSERLELLRRDATAPFLDAVRQAHAAMPVTRTTPQGWLLRLEAVLQALDARGRLAADPAGRAVLDLLAARGEELRGCAVKLDFAEWRAWLNDELDGAAFRDTAIDSPVVLTSLAATRLRRFDAAVVIGADARQLRAAVPEGLFGSPALRAELGLASPDEQCLRLRDDLAWLMESCEAVTFTWQHLRGDEANPPAPELALLDVLHQLAYGTRLQQPGRRWPAPQAQPAPPDEAPRAPQLLPAELSVSQLARLVACPYRFYAASLLGLEPADEVAEAMEKRDYGDLAHRVLAAFHTRFESLSDHDDATLCDALQALAEAVFRPELAKSFLAHAWMARLSQRIPGYVAWARAREAEGWRVAATETPRRVAVDLGDGGVLAVRGRLDRVDRRGDTLAVLDYKTRREKSLRDQLRDPGEDLQLAAYTWLAGEAVSEAAYVALDDEAPKTVPLPEPQAMARLQRERLVASLTRIRAGAPLYPFPDEATCRHCDMAGLCRKDYRP